MIEAGEGLAFEVETSAEADAGEEIGGGDADSCGGSGEGVFGDADVRAQTEQFSGFGDGDA